MRDGRISEEDYKKQSEDAIKQIVELLNKYNLTIVAEHNIKIIPKEPLK